MVHDGKNIITQRVKDTTRSTRFVASMKKEFSKYNNSQIDLVWSHPYGQLRVSTWRVLKSLSHRQWSQLWNLVIFIIFKRSDCYFTTMKVGREKKVRLESVGEWFPHLNLIEMQRNWPHWTSFMASGHGNPIKNDGKRLGRLVIGTYPSWFRRYWE